MKEHRVLAFPIGRRDNDPNPGPTGYGCMLPVGAVPMAVAAIEGQPQLFAGVPWSGANTKTVWHPLIMARLGEPVNLLIGRKLGPSLGSFSVTSETGNSVAYFAFIDDPWPITSLDLAPAQGHG